MYAGYASYVHDQCVKRTKLGKLIREEIRM